MTFERTGLFTLALAAGFYVLGPAGINPFQLNSGPVRAQESNANDAAVWNRLNTARKALNHAERRLEHARFTGEGVQAAIDALATAKTEMQAAEQAFRTSVGERPGENAGSNAVMN